MDVEPKILRLNARYFYFCSTVNRTPFKKNFNGFSKNFENPQRKKKKNPRTFLSSVWYQWEAWFCECSSKEKKNSVSLFFPGNDLFTQLPLKGLRVRALPWRLCLSNHRENVYQVAVLNYLENEENDDVEKKTQFVISEDY